MISNQIEGLRLGGKGPNSKSFKFKKSMCANCNGHRSQPFDRAYDEFISHVVDGRNRLFQSRRIDLSEIWDEEWPGKFMDVLRYYTKHAACRLVEDCQLEIDEQVVEFLNGGQPPAFLTFDFTLWGDMAGIITAYEKVFKDRFGFVAVGPIFLHGRDGGDQIVGVESDTTSRWLRVHWWYGSTIHDFGHPAPDGLLVLTDPHSDQGEIGTIVKMAPVFLASKVYRTTTGRDLQRDFGSVQSKLAWRK